MGWGEEVVNRQEALTKITELHREWADSYGDDQVAYRPEDEGPHDGNKTDYPEHHADRSAPAEIDDPLNEQIKRILSEIEDASVASGQVWQGCPRGLHAPHDGPCP